MKTITITDDAYARLKSWKHAGRDSFSAVIERVVPEKGTLASVLDFIEQIPVHDARKDELLEKTVRTKIPAKHDPWA